MTPHDTRSAEALLAAILSRAAILTFAKSIGVHPGIIVGRLQHDDDLPYTYFRNLLDRVKPQLQAFVSAED